MKTKLGMKNKKTKIGSLSGHNQFEGMTPDEIVRSITKILNGIPLVDNNELNMRMLCKHMVKFLPYLLEGGRLMIQRTEAGGLELLIDGVRPEDMEIILKL